MLPLLYRYQYEVDTLDECEWHKSMLLFDDANIYQTCTYASIRSGEKHTSKFVLRKDGQIVALAQVRLLRIPLLNFGIAYVRWGPIWNVTGNKQDLEVFRQAIRGLRNEYVVSRGLGLRIYPYLFEDKWNIFAPIFADEGYVIPMPKTAGRTMLMDVSCPIECLRKGLDKRWRKHLCSAESKALSFIEGYDDDLFNLLMHLYNEMVEIKHFALPNDINEFREIQKRLPSELKMRIILCLSDGKPSAGALCCTTGNFGMNIYRATNMIGRQTKASYLLQWHIIEWVKNQKCTYYNVNGINPENNPGTYAFKSGLCGKNGQDVYYLGIFDSYKSSHHANLINVLELLGSNWKTITNKIFRMAPFQS